MSENFPDKKSSREMMEEVMEELEDVKFHFAAFVGYFKTALENFYNENRLR